MPSGVGGGISPAIPVKPGEGTLWAFITGTWQAASLATFLAASPLVDASTFVVGDLDATKRLGFQADTQATASTLTIDVGAQTASRTLLVPVLTASDTIATLGLAQTFTAAQTLSLNANASIGILVTNPNAGANNASYFEARADVGKLIFQAQASGNSSTLFGSLSRAGQSELLARDNTGGCNGLTLGCGAIDKPITFGINAALVAQLTGGTLSTGALLVKYTTTAVSPIAGALIVGDGATTATNVSIGGGNINAGGTIAGGGDLTVTKSVNGALTLTINNTNAGASAESRFSYPNDAGNGMLLEMFSSGFGAGLANFCIIGSQGAGFAGMKIGPGVSAPMILRTSGTDRLTVSGAGDISLSSTTDATAIGTAALVSAGGASLAKSLWVGGTAGNFINIANATGALKINSTQVVGPRITGYGTPTGGVNQGSFAAGSITLANLAAGFAQLILDLKTHGLLGT
jgi:hypothetical protein